MNKKILKIALIIIMIFVILFLVSSQIYAFSLDKIYTDANNFVKNQQSAIPTNKIAEILKPIANGLLAIGLVVIFVVGVVMGIRYLTAPPDQQGKLKGQLIGLVVSAIVLTGSYGIWSIAYTIMRSITTQ